MNKKEVQQRVLQNGKPLDLSKFTWDKNTKTFSSSEDNLVIDFNYINGCTFNTGSYCTFNTGSECTFNTGSYCTFNTGYDCTFKNGSECTFTTGYGCTFNSGSECTFTTGSYCVVVRRDMFEVIQLEQNVNYKLCPFEIKGYLKEIDGKFYLNGVVENGEHIIADGILSKIISSNKKDELVIYKVINHKETEESYLIKKGNIYSHGSTIKEAKDSLKYKISDRNTDKFGSWKLDDVKTLEEIIEAYRCITGACESGTRYFCENNDLPKKASIKEWIEITKGQYNNELFTKFFMGDK